MSRHALLCAAALLAGCFVTSDTLTKELTDAWVGKPIAEVVRAEKRSPTQVITLPDNTSRYAWIKGSCETAANVNTSGIVTSVSVTGCTLLEIGGKRYE